MSTATVGLPIGPSHAELVRRRNTYPCQSCRTEPVLYPRVICQACARPEEIAA